MAAFFIFVKRVSTIKLAKIDIVAHRNSISAYFDAVIMFPNGIGMLLVFQPIFLLIRWKMVCFLRISFLINGCI
jgi:hypothetical protein